MPRTQFTFYESWYKAVSQLKKKSDQAETMDAICKYALYAEEPDISGPPAAIFESIRPALNTARKKSENGKKGGSKGKAKESKPEEEGSKGETRNSTSTRNSNRTICYSPETSSSRKFAPPSVDEVAAYVREKGYHIDPETFVAFYQSKGWKVGSQPMKDWKAAVTTWEKKDKAAASQPESEARERREEWEKRFYGGSE